MSEMANSMNHMADVMQTRREGKSRLVEQPPGPTLPTDTQEKAIAILEGDKTHFGDELNEVIVYFLADLNLARVYATLRSPSARLGYLEFQLKKLRAADATKQAAKGLDDDMF